MAEEPWGPDSPSEAGTVDVTSTASPSALQRVCSGSDIPLIVSVTSLRSSWRGGGGGRYPIIEEETESL